MCPATVATGAPVAHGAPHGDDAARLVKLVAEWAAYFKHQSLGEKRLPLADIAKLCCQLAVALRREAKRNDDGGRFRRWVGAKRLDIGTSGVMLVAKTCDAFVKIRKQFNDKTASGLEKEYSPTAR